MAARLAALILGLAAVVPPGVGLAQDCLEPVGRSLYGVVHAVVADGQRVLVGNGGVLQIIDLAFDREHVFTVRYASGFESFTLCHDPIFADGFESGDTSAWASVGPKRVPNLLILME